MKTAAKAETGSLMSEIPLAHGAEIFSAHTSFADHSCPVCPPGAELLRTPGGGPVPAQRWGFRRPAGPPALPFVRCCGTRPTPNVSPTANAVRSGTLGVMTTRERLQELADQICSSMRNSQRPAEPPVRSCPALRRPELRHEAGTNGPGSGRQARGSKNFGRPPGQVVGRSIVMTGGVVGRSEPPAGSSVIIRRWAAPRPEMSTGRAAAAVKVTGDQVAAGPTSQTW
jgi:hypothetical protein